MPADLLPRRCHRSNNGPGPRGYEGSAERRPSAVCQLGWLPRVQGACITPAPGPALLKTPQAPQGILRLSATSALSNLQAQAIYLFGHRVLDRLARYHKVALVSEPGLPLRQIELSDGHYIPAGADPTGACTRLVNASRAHATELEKQQALHAWQAAKQVLQREATAACDATCP